MNRLLPVVLAAGASVALVAWVYSHRFYPVRHAPVAGQRIVAFGDSLVVGVGASAGHDFVSQLSARLLRPVVNAGHAGDTTATARGRLEAVLTEHQPDLLIVLLGGNDALSRLPRTETLQNLEAIIRTAHNRGAAVLLLGVRGGLIGDPYRREFAKLARRTRAAYLPNILDSVWGNSFLMSDEIHPNDLGYGVMADRAQAAVKQLIAPSP